MSFYDDASLIMYPSGYKEDKIYSLKPTNGTGDLNFSRASSATRVNSEGLIETATVFGSELVTNGDIESGLPTVNGNSFTQYQATISQSSAVAHASTNSMKVTGTGTLFNTRVIPNNASYVSKVFVVSLWVYNPTSLTGNIVVRKRINGIPSDIGTLSTKDTWTNFTYNTTSQNPSVDRFIEVEAQTGLNTEFFYVDDITIKEVITSNVPRIDYSNGCGSLLLEKQSTNLVTYSESFDNAYWTKTGSSVTSGFTSPDGTTNAFKLVEDTSTGIHILQPTTPITTVIGTSYSLSAFYKIGERPYAIIGLHYNGSNGCIAEYEFSTDTFVYSSASGTNYSISNLKSIILSNGFVRLSCTVTTGHTVAFPSFGIYKDLLISGIIGNNTYTGDGTSGVYIYGAMLEQGSYPTSYIPTAGTTVTRLADTSGTTGLSDVIGQTEGTMFVEVDIKAASSGYHTLIQIYGDANNRIAIGQDINTTNLFMYINGSGTASLQSTTTSAGHYKVALAYKSGDTVLYVNGSSAITNSRTITLSTSLATLFLNNFIGTEIGTYENYQSQLYKTRLSNTELATLTTI